MEQRLVADRHDDVERLADLRAEELRRRVPMTVNGTLSRVTVRPIASLAERGRDQAIVSTGPARTMCQSTVGDMPAPQASLLNAPPIANEEADAILTALKAPKRWWPLIAIIGIRYGMRTAAFLPCSSNTRASQDDSAFDRFDMTRRKNR
jgi:hypothetical protein